MRIASAGCQDRYFRLLIKDMNTLPTWQLSRIYSSFTGNDLREHRELLDRQLHRITELVGDIPAEEEKKAAWISEYIDCYNACNDLFANLYAFAYMHYSVNTANYSAINCMNDLDKAKIPLISSLVAFRNALGRDFAIETKTAGKSDRTGHSDDTGPSAAGPLQDLFTRQPVLQEYGFFLKEQLVLQKHQMSREREELAAELSRSGADLWSRLQEAVSSQTAVFWDEKSGEKKTVTELRAMAHDPDRDIRQKAFTLEIAAWESVKIPMAYALNGVKGFSVSLNSHRGFSGTLECSLLQARINRNVLNALIDTMQRSLPEFRRYLKVKAGVLGLKKLAFFDLFAPLHTVYKKWSFPDARNFITECFSGFSHNLGRFAEAAFAGHWIDARPRTGKVGGAYCISLPLSRESRVLSNFDGSFSAVTTLAHELGHAYHHHLLRDASAIHRDYPMTLAETASIFSENIIIDNALKSFPGEEKINLLEAFLADSTQVIVDILSRFYFESELISQRENKELSADELNTLMLEAQRKTYGDGLDEKLLHPYMWAVKSHYYRAELAFYNFPYAFGLLFGLGLHALYGEQGATFTGVYEDLLKHTGRMDCMELTGQVGFDIESPAFWQKGISVIKKRIDEYEALAAELSG